MAITITIPEIPDTIGTTALDTADDYYVLGYGSLFILDTDNNKFKQVFSQTDENFIKPLLVIDDLDSLCKEIGIVKYSAMKLFDEDWIYIGDNKLLLQYVLCYNKEPIALPWQKLRTNHIVPFEESYVKEYLDKWLHSLLDKFEIEEN